MHVKFDSASINKGKLIDKRQICWASNVKCCDGSDNPPLFPVDVIGE